MKGIGIDLISVDRMQDLWERHGERLRGDLFSEREWAAISGGPGGMDTKREKIRRLGRMFAAKEAAVKALAIGAVPFNWYEIEIWGEARVAVRLQGEVAALADRSGIRRLYGMTTAGDTTCLAVIVGE